MMVERGSGGKMIKKMKLVNIIFLLLLFCPVKSQQCEEPELKEYKRYLMELSKEKAWVREFFKTHSFKTLELFLSKDRFSAENLQKISELERPYQYFDFLFRLSTEDKRFEKFSFGEFMKGYYQKVLDDPWTFYDAYEKLYQKSDCVYAEIFAEYFWKFAIIHTEFFLYKFEKDPDWRKKTAGLLTLDVKMLDELIERVPDTPFGIEFKKFIIELKKKSEEH